MANMLSGSKQVPASCYCHRCMCCGSRGYIRKNAIKHVKRRARRKERTLWRREQEAA